MACAVKRFLVGFGVAVLIGLVLTAVRSEPTPGADLEQVAQGERLYGLYCAACHGKTARGDGPTAKVLKTRPADLTRLTPDDGEEFPAARVREAIDGRGAAHGTPEMPLWGLAFQDWASDANQEKDVARRIDALVAWLESIQR